MKGLDKTSNFFSEVKQIHSCINEEDFVERFELKFEQRFFMSLVWMVGTAQSLFRY